MDCLDGRTAALFASLERHDLDTAQHCRRVQQLALGLAEALELPGEQCARLGMAAILHDVGKLGVRLQTLNKPGPLTAAEYEQIKKHSVIGALLVAMRTDDREVIEAVRYHHERYDGRGYPAGFRGRAIPLLARIVAIADSFDAMTASRPYRKACTWEKACSVLRQEAGAQFDPLLVEPFVAMLEGAAFPVWQTEPSLATEMTLAVG